MVLEIPRELYKYILRTYTDMCIVIHGEGLVLRSIENEEISLRFKTPFSIALDVYMYIHMRFDHWQDCANDTLAPTPNQGFYVDQQKKKTVESTIHTLFFSLFSFSRTYTALSHRLPILDFTYTHLVRSRG